MSDTNVLPNLVSQSHEVSIALSAEDAWSVVGDFSDLTWLEIVKHSSADRGNVLGSVRTLDFGKATLTEKLIEYDGDRYSYKCQVEHTASNISSFGIRNVESTVSVETVSPEDCIVRWSSTFVRPDLTLALPPSQALGLSLLAERALSDADKYKSQ